MASGSSTMQVGEFTVEVTRPDKALFPDGTSKRELAEYYHSAAGRMLPYLTDRPLAMQRFPDGIEHGQIFQKQVPDYFPEWVTRLDVPKEDGTVTQVVCDKAATLVYLAGQACVTPHVFLSRTDQLDHPDQLIFDLDPPDAGQFDAARRAALALRQLLEEELGLVTYAKTTGGKGMHVHAPLDRSADFDTVREVARDIAGTFAARDPDQLTVEQRKDKRGDRIFIDVLRNAYAQTAVPPYAVRAAPGAPVATPVSWEEVADRRLRPDQFTLHNARQRLTGDDPWAGMRRRARKLDRPRKRLAAIGT